MKKLIQQILKFGVVGFLCFFIDYGIMVALTELCGISSVISSGISFSVSVIVNYILSITVVFDADKEANKAKQFVIFLILSIIGLGINQVIMWGGTSWLDQYMDAPTCWLKLRQQQLSWFIILLPERYLLNTEINEACRN